MGILAPVTVFVDENWVRFAKINQEGKLGRTEIEVTTHIHFREAHAMFEHGFHEKRVPAADVGE